jgi:hypothetical protein
MDNELVRLWIERRRRFQSSHERTMSELCLGISADDRTAFTEWQPVCLLLWRALKFNRGNEHEKVKSKGGIIADRVPIGFRHKEALTLALHLELKEEPTPTQSATVHFCTIYFSIGCWKLAVVSLAELLVQFLCKLFKQFVTTMIDVSALFNLSGMNTSDADPW